MAWTDRIAHHFEVNREALAWFREQPSPEVAWATCQRLDWMIWLLASLSPDAALLELANIAKRWPHTFAAAMMIQGFIPGKVSYFTSEHLLHLAKWQEMKAAEGPSRDIHLGAGYMLAAPAWAGDALRGVPQMATAAAHFQAGSTPNFGSHNLPRVLRDRWPDRRFKTLFYASFAQPLDD